MFALVCLSLHVLVDIAEGLLCLHVLERLTIRHSNSATMRLAAVTFIPACYMKSPFYQDEDGWLINHPMSMLRTVCRVPV